jgi:predicted amidohydrolase
MRATAESLHIHLAGSFLRRQGNEIYNTLLLAAPEGREWRYDKHYPWFWERAYFQQGSQTTIADTSLGRIGLLICWDVAHAELWQRYAGQVDLMAVSSCPPNVMGMSLVFPDGQRIAGSNAGALVQYLKRTTDETFGQFLRRQSAWLGVPLVNTTGTGRFSTAIPNSKSSMTILTLVVPRLWKYRAQFGQARMETGYFNETYVADAAGKVLERVALDAEGYALSQVNLADNPPAPNGKQPAYGIPAMTYWMDDLIKWMVTPQYRKNTREIPGQ